MPAQDTVTVIFWPRILTVRMLALPDPGPVPVPDPGPVPTPVVAAVFPMVTVSLVCAAASGEQALVCPVNGPASPAKYGETALQPAISTTVSVTV